MPACDDSWQLSGSYVGAPGRSLLSGMQELPDEHPFTVASSFAKRQLAVTKHKVEQLMRVRADSFLPRDNSL
eukprot:6047304-Amphidinium_carterae.1